MNTKIENLSSIKNLPLFHWATLPNWARALLAVVMMCVLGSIFPADGAFFHASTHWDLLRQVTVPGLVALGMCLVIVTGGIDLSVGSMLGLSSVLFSLLTIHRDFNASSALLLCLTAGALMGLFNAFLINVFQLKPFMATLSMMVFWRGVCKWLSGGQKISSAIPLADGTFGYKELPTIFNVLDQKVLGHTIPVVGLIFLSMALLVGILLHKTYWGKHLLAVGGNEWTSRFSGIPVARRKALAYMVCGLLASLAGICQAVQEGQGDPETGAGIELNAIAMVVMGGTALNGGKGSIVTTLFGIWAIGLLEKILSLNAVPESLRLLMTGAIIIVAVLVQRENADS